MFLQTSSSFVSLILFLTSLFYLWTKYAYGYWKRRGVYSPPAVFLLGHMGKSSLLLINFGEMIGEWYLKTRKHAYVGLYMFYSRTLLVNSLDAIKSVFVKDFTHFQGHGFKSNKSVDPLGHNMFNTEGDEWKSMRTRLAPAFTAAKIKQMFELMETTASDMMESIHESVSEGEAVDVKDLMAKFTTDVIGKCGFGLNLNSFKYLDSIFRKMGRRALTKGGFRTRLSFLSFSYPKLMKFLRISPNYSDVTKFFTNLVPETISNREKDNVTRNDLLQSLIAMNKKDPKSGEHCSMEEITAQVFLFYLAGYETSATSSGYTLLELARNQDIQDKVREEILQIVEEEGGKITYEATTKMTYLTKVLQESLRLYPVVPFLFRFCTKDYTIPETKSVVEEGTLVIIPVLGIHRDPDIYPDPMKFDPERFTPENIASRHPFAFLPFGEGPRICIGKRFGMVEMQLAISSILRDYRISICDESPKTIKFDGKGFFLHFVGEIFLKFEHITY